MANPDWKGLFEWSMKYQDGTAQQAAVQPMAESDRRWFEEAVRDYTVNVSQHMVKIKQELETAEQSGDDDSVARKEELLEELLEIVESIDHAKDLTSIGGLETLMALLKDKHASLRWRAAEVVATCAQNNLPVQEWLLKAGCLPKLIRLLEDPDTTCRQKGLLAISCLIRNNAEGTNAFVAEDGIDWLVRSLREDQTKVQRKALQLLDHVAQILPQRIPSKKLLPLVIKAAFEVSSEVREAALLLLSRLARDQDILDTLKSDDTSTRKLKAKVKEISELSSEEADTYSDERESIEQLLSRIQTGLAAEGRQPEQQLQPNINGNEAAKKPLLLLG